MVNTVLREILRIGPYKLQDEEELLKARADTRTRINMPEELRDTSKVGRSKLSVPQVLLEESLHSAREILFVRSYETGNFSCKTCERRSQSSLHLAHH